jgi:hypothetical protein
VRVNEAAADEVIARFFQSGGEDEHLVAVKDMLTAAKLNQLHSRHLVLPLQSGDADRYQVPLAPPGLVALVDIYVDEEGWCLELVNILYDPDWVHEDPWGLP